MLELRLDGHAEPLRLTGTHRLFSTTLADWVAARELQPGETLRTRAGTATVESIHALPGVHRVYNVEVESEHRLLRRPQPSPQPQ